MKVLKISLYLILTIVFLLTFYIKGAVAQDKFLNDSRSQTQQVFAKNDLKKVHTGKTNNDEYEYDQYEVGENMFLSFYYKTDVICDYITELFMNKSDLIAAIQDLNQRFERIDSTHWISKDKIAQVVLEVKDKYFSVIYKKI
jgi:hypothetical protein